MLNITTGVENIMATTGGGSKKIDRAWFRARLEVLGISQRELAGRLDMEPAALSRMLNGTRKMSSQEMWEMSAKLGASVNDVAKHMGLDPISHEGRPVLVAGTVGEGGLVTIGVPSEARHESPAAGLAASARALRFNSEGASDGWVAYYEPTTRVDPDAINRLAVVKLDGKGGTWVRVLKRGYRMGGHNLVDCFGKAPVMEGVRVASASPVLWLKTN